MTRHTYLMKSRHGVYYLRVVLPKNAIDQLGRRAGELRLSLRTKSKWQAKLRLAETLYMMTKTNYPMPWEAEADQIDPAEASHFDIDALRARAKDNPA